jgi:2,3-bisphosphoglycerate-independent phosphoglycerate mutase
MNKPFVLLILDGWGIAPKNRGNAIELAKKPNFDEFWKKYPHTQLRAHGEFVGLPKNQVGNSEAGHMNIGADSVVEQDSTLISSEIKSGRFFNNPGLLKAINHAKKSRSALHLFGLVSRDGSPHSSLDHLYALVELAYTHEVKDVYLHLITDGRDSPQFSALGILDKIFKKINGKARLASVMGRFYAMDRGKNWERTEEAYDCLTLGTGFYGSNYSDVILHAYNQKITDEYIEPSVICGQRNQGQIRNSRLSDNDAVIFFNLRSDRARQLTKCFVQKNFNKDNPGAFRRRKVLKNLVFVAFTDFGPDLDQVTTAFPSAVLKDTLPMVLSDLRQLYIAETEKYAHVTYFINGGYADPVNGEDRVRISSVKVVSYAEKPAMSVYKIKDKIKSVLKANKYDFIVANFANPDMVGHTGNLKATIEAVEHVDKCLGEVVEVVLKKKGTVVVIGDHGNAEKMIDLKTKEVWTEHTTNKVPFILIGDDFKKIKLREGVLSDVAPTIYNLLKKNIKINKGLIK